MTIGTIKVLLIDDDEDDYILTRELFSMVKGGQYALEWAPSYEEGVMIAARREHHVCLVDYHLGERCGVQLIREIRESGISMPMILLTGQGDHDLDVEAMEAGATDYLVKDETSPARLERTIRYAAQLSIERTRAEEELQANAQKQAAVAELGRLALAGGELKDLSVEAVSLVARTLGVKYCKIFELLPNGTEFLLRAGVGWKKEFVIGQTKTSADKDTQAGFTLHSDEPVVMEEMLTESRFNGSPLLLEHGIVSGVSVIIRGRDRPHGVLGAHTDSLRRFSADDVNFLRAVANVLAEAVNRKHAENALRTQKESFGHIISAAPLIFVGITPEGTTTFVNQAIHKVTGYQPDELIGKNWWRILYPGEDYGQVEQLFKVFDQSGVNDCEMNLTTKSGEQRCVTWSSVNRLDKSGDLIEVICIGNDITDRNRTEKSLSQSESQFRALFENALDAVLIANDQGVYVDANPAACELMGVSHNELVGRTIDDFTEEEEKADTSRIWEQFLKDRTMRGEFRLRRADGKVVEVDFSATANFTPGRHLSLLRDVTERRTLESQVRQSQKLESVGMLAGGIAHDFNNLLTVISGYSELTLRRLDVSDPLAVNIEEIRKAAARATSLTRQLLAFSRKQVLQPKILDLNSVILGIEKMVGRLIGEDMELRTMPSIGLGRVKADPGQIEQVILNLVVNARDAMPKGGKITIETANIYLDEGYVRRHVAVQPGWYAMLAVTDTGSGMDAETQRLIFEPFFTTKEQGKGTGLGLSTVYGIVKQSGGNIWVYSEVGLGTAFKIYLPLVDEQAPDAEAVPACLESTLGTETILIAEDEEMVRILARESLRANGYTVLEAANAEAALLISEQHEGPIHLLLTDVVMPRMSGKDLAEQILMSRPQVRILYMSGYTDQAIVHHGILEPDIAFIAKPFTPDTLVFKVVEVLSAPPMLQSVA